jgi:hypothetical protein
MNALQFNPKGREDGAVIAAPCLAWWNAARLMASFLEQVILVGPVTTAALGIYASIDSMHTAYATNPNLTAWPCKSPTG